MTEADALAIDPVVRFEARRLAARAPKYALIGEDDLVSAGWIGALQAAGRYKPERGAVNAFLRYRIRGAMIDELRKMDALPRTARDRSTAIAAGAAEARIRLSRISVTEAAAFGGVSRRRAVCLLAAARLGFPESDAPDTIMGRSLSPAEIAERREEAGLAMDALARLPARLADVIRRYYFGGQTQAEIGGHIGVSEARVHQLRKLALARLRIAIAKRRHCWAVLALTDQSLS